jgi:ABC-2 type transport system permease protein
MKTAVLKIFLQLLRRDFLLLRQEFWGNLINVLFWLVPNIFVFIYILPGLAVDASYGIFVLTGVIAAQGLFTAISTIPGLLADIEDNHAIYYYLSLPIPQWLLLVRYALNFAIGAFMMSVFLLPACMLLLCKTFDFAAFSLFKYLIFFLTLQLFFGFFTLLVAAYTKNMVQYERAWVRVVWPLVFLGGYQFSWQTLKTQLPWLAYGVLLNPLTYCLEGFRAAVLGQTGFINFWICFGLISFFTVISALIGIKKLMRRLDCIN